jgi:hypothetical protein
MSGGESWLRMSSFRPAQRRETEVPTSWTASRPPMPQPESTAPPTAVPLPPAPSLVEIRVPAEERPEKRRRASSAGAGTTERSDRRGGRDADERGVSEPRDASDRADGREAKRHRSKRKDREHKEKKEKKRKEKDKAKRRRRRTEEAGARRTSRSLPHGAPPTADNTAGGRGAAGRRAADTGGGPTDLEKRVARDRVMLVEDPRARVPARWQVRIGGGGETSRHDINVRPITFVTRLGANRYWFHCYCKKAKCYGRCAYAEGEWGGDTSTGHRCRARYFCQDMRWRRRRRWGEGGEPLLMGRPCLSVFLYGRQAREICREITPA